MDKFIEVFEYKFDYDTNKIKLLETSLISLYKISSIYITEYSNNWAVIVSLDNRETFCYSLCNSKENAYQILNILKDKLNGKEN
jgi:hypothetical protein